MLNINNNSTNVKRELLVRIAKLQLAGKLDSREINKIPTQMRPTGSDPIGCCVFHDRELLRMRILARMGISVENYNDENDIPPTPNEVINAFCVKLFFIEQAFESRSSDFLLKVFDQFPDHD